MAPALLHNDLNLKLWWQFAITETNLLNKALILKNTVFANLYYSIILQVQNIYEL